MRLDLHGYTIHNAWSVFKTHLHDCYLDGYKTTVIVTGYGQMSKEIESWCSANEYAVSCTRLDPNQGAFRIKLKKRPRTANATPNNFINELSALQQKYQK